MYQTKSQYHRGQNYYIPFFSFGEFFSVVIIETLQHAILGEINYCNVRIGAVFPWKVPMETTNPFQLQLFSLCYVGINFCNVTLFLYRMLPFQNIICSNFVLNSTNEKPIEATIVDSLPTAISQPQWAIKCW